MYLYLSHTEERESLSQYIRSVYETKSEVPVLRDYVPDLDTGVLDRILLRLVGLGTYDSFLEPGPRFPLSLGNTHKLVPVLFQDPSYWGWVFEYTRLGPIFSDNTRHCTWGEKH